MLRSLVGSEMCIRDRIMTVLISMLSQAFADDTSITAEQWAKLEESVAGNGGIGEQIEALLQSLPPEQAEQLLSLIDQFAGQAAGEQPRAEGEAQ